jgi:hypothetical protein
VTPREILESLEDGIEIPEEIAWLEADASEATQVTSPLAPVAPH